MTTFNFTGVEDAGGGATLDDVRNLLAGPEVASLLPPGTIGNQVDGQGSGIPTGKIRRGLLGPLYGTPSVDYTVPVTGFAELDPVRLAGVLVCTGRPVRIDISAGLNKGTSTGIVLSVAMDGVEVTQTYDGLCWNYTTLDLFVCGWRILTPRPGPRRFAIVAHVVTSGSGTVYSAANDLVQLAVAEL